MAELLPENQEHTDAYYARVLIVLSFLAENPMMLSKKYSKELLKFVCESFGVQERMARNYIRDAKKEWIKRGDINIEEAYSETLNQYDDIIRRARENSKMDIEFRAIKEKAVMMGVYEGSINKDTVITIERKVIEKDNEE